MPYANPYPTYPNIPPPHQDQALPEMTQRECFKRMQVFMSEQSVTCRCHLWPFSDLWHLQNIPESADVWHKWDDHGMILILISSQSSSQLTRSSSHVWLYKIQLSPSINHWHLGSRGHWSATFGVHAIPGCFFATRIKHGHSRIAWEIAARPGDPNISTVPEYTVSIGPMSWMKPCPFQCMFGWNIGNPKHPCYQIPHQSLWNLGRWPLERIAVFPIISWP